MLHIVYCSIFKCIIVHTVLTGQRCLFCASRYLKAILFGRNAHLNALVVCNLWRLARRLYDAGAQEWHARQGTCVTGSRSGSGQCRGLGDGRGIMSAVTLACAGLRLLMLNSMAD